MDTSRDGCRGEYGSTQPSPPAEHATSAPPAPCATCRVLPQGGAAASPLLPNLPKQPVNTHSRRAQSSKVRPQSGAAASAAQPPISFIHPNKPFNNPPVRCAVSPGTAPGWCRGGWVPSQRRRGPRCRSPAPGGPIDTRGMEQQGGREEQQQTTPSASAMLRLRHTAGAARRKPPFTHLLLSTSVNLALCDFTPHQLLASL